MHCNIKHIKCLVVSTKVLKKYFNSSFVAEIFKTTETRTMFGGFLHLLG